MLAMRRKTALLLALALAGAGAMTFATPVDGFAQTAKKKKKKSKTSMAQPKKGLSLGTVAAKQKTPERDRLDAAIRQLKEERYAPAAVSLFDMVESTDTSAPLRDEARYNLAKALYRLQLHHGALHHFTELLSRGPSTSFYGPSLEWCLFIARKITADDRVLQAVAKYSDGTFPPDYEGEFNYLLARHHYLRGMAVETTLGTSGSGEARVEEAVSGGRSLKGDVFGDIFGDGEATPEPDDDVVTRSGRGITIDEDLFGDDEDDPPKKKDAPKKDAPKAPPKRADNTEFTAKEHLEAATRSVGRVKPTAPEAARAKFLEAVLLYHGGKANEALEAFKSVVRLAKEGSPQADSDLRQLAFFQLARTHFGAKQPSFALYYYDKMQRFTEEWLEALYESSWAEFRLGNYEKALGNLLTLHSPFFEDEYFPESHVLKAVVYYENCRYTEAKRILTRFMKRYEPVLGELDRLTKRRQEATKYYEVLSNLREGDTAKVGTDKAAIMSQILTIALSDPELEKLDASYREVDGELKSLGDQGEVFNRSGLKRHLIEVTTKVRSELQADAGRAVKRKLEAERDAIKGLITQAVRIEVETAAAEQHRIESTLRDINSRPKEVDKEFVEWADDEKLVWPFDDEYWRDELGTYELTLAQSCR